MNDLDQQILFITELEKLKAVYRKTTIKEDNNRYENSAEHSWHIAIMATTLAEYAERPIDISRVVNMLLLHDVVEIDAGDMFAFAGDADHEAQAEQEAQAAQRIFGLLPENKAEHFLTLWYEFELAETDDAKFAKAMDRILPVFQNIRNDGGSWRAHNISKQQIIRRNAYLQDSAPALWQYVLKQVDIAVNNGWLKAD